MAENGKNFSDKVRGCLWGLALGDAFGQPVEFDTVDEIKYDYGENGIQDVPDRAIWTDDTEMTIANIQALSTLGPTETIMNTHNQRIGGVFAQSFIEWMENPGYSPGNTCMCAAEILEEIGPENWENRDKNNSKGCGSAMRAAPIGLWFAQCINNLDCKRKFIKISEIQSELTHGHKAATAAALASSYAVALAMNGIKPSEMIAHVKDLCGSIHQDFDSAMERLEESLKSQSSGECNDIEALSHIGQGWVGEQAFALALYSAIRFEEDFKNCMRLAVNHSGDSDSVGCIAGSILGAYLGFSLLPDEWIENLAEKDRYSAVVDSVCAILNP